MLGVYHYLAGGCDISQSFSQFEILSLVHGYTLSEDLFGFESEVLLPGSSWLATKGKLF